MKEAVMFYAVLLTSQDSVNKQTVEQRTYAYSNRRPRHICCSSIRF